MKLRIGKAERDWVKARAKANNQTVAAYIDDACSRHWKSVRAAREDVHAAGGIVCDGSGVTVIDHHSWHDAATVRACLRMERANAPAEARRSRSLHRLVRNQNRDGSDMAWNPSLKVADCREIARKWGMKQVIIIGMTDDQIAMATYGETKAMCADAKRLGDHAYDAVMAHYEDPFANNGGQS